MRKRSTRCFTLLLLIYVLVFTSIVTSPTTVSSTEADVIAALLELSVIISNLPDEAFEDPSAADNHRNTLCNKIDAVINKVEAGAYGAAVNKLENDIKKTIVNWIVDPWETELLEQVDEIIRLIPPVHDIAVTGVTISPTEVYLGNQAYIGVTVANEGTESETFDVYVYVDQDTAQIGDEITLGPITTVLNVGATATLGFIWDTTGVAEDTYTVSAEAVVALDDYPANNLFVDGTVTVLPNVGWIDGTVTDATTSDPLVGATVEADGNLATTDTTGYYKIELSPGDYAVTASMTGYITQSKPAHVDAGETTTVDFALGAVTHTLEVISNPISGIAFTVDGTTYATPWSGSLPERTHTIVMPSTWGIYSFNHWEDSSTNPTRTVFLTTDKTITAYYVKRQWTLNVDSNPIDGIEFTVDGVTHTTPWSNLLDEGSYTVVMPSTWTVGIDVYDFDHWEDASTDPARIVALTSDTTITAYYVLAPKYWTLTINSDPIDSIEFTIDGVTHTTPYSTSLIEGFHTIIMPSTWDIYDFDHWEDASTNPTRTISLTSDLVVTAYYVARQWTLNVNSDPITGVDFTIDGVTHTTTWSSLLNEGSYTIVMPSTWMVGAEEYEFDHWDDMSTDPTRVISLTADMSITAYYVFVPPTYWTLTINSDAISGINFTVDGATHTTPWSDSLPEGTYTVVMPSTWTVGTDVYNFNHWEDTSTNPTRIIDLTANTAVTAYYQYVAVSHKLTVDSDPITGIEFTINGATQITLWTGDLAEGSHTVVMPVTWTTTASDVYNFDHWEDASTNPTRTVSLTAEMVITAYYVLAPKYWTLTVDSEPVTGIEFTINSVNHTTPWSDSLSEGPYTIVMPSYWTISTNTYSFDQWEDSSTNPTRTISLTANTTVTAIYKLCVDPVASFTYEPIDPFLNQNVTFDASTSTPDSGHIINYEWDFGDGTTGTSMNVTHTYVAYGNFSVTLNVTDSEGLWDVATDIVYVYPHPPMANFTFLPLTPYTDETVTFDATESYDPDGDIIWYYWSFGDHTYLNTTDRIVHHAYDDDKTYTITLVVSDNEGLNSTVSDIVTVPNRSPVAIFTESAEIVLTNSAIHFDASDSYDPDGTILSYFWDFGDRHNATGVTANHTYADDGVYTVTLTITDDDGETASKTATKTVSNRPPIALFTENATIVDINELIRFDASSSYDPDGTILSYFWDFGDGTDATMCVLLHHAYTEDGNYTVTLTVTDDDGASASVSTTKTVKGPPMWPLSLIAGIALGIAALTGTVIYAIFRRKKRSSNEVTTLENKPIVTLYVPRGFFAGYEKLTKAADNSVVLGRT